MDQLNDTYSISGPFTVHVDLFDDVQDGMAIDENDTISYNFIVNWGEIVSGTPVPVDIGADGNGTYSFSIEGAFMPGDQIEYWVSAVDEDGIHSESIHLVFHILEPGQPDANLLLIADSRSEHQLPAFETMADHAVSSLMRRG